MVWKSPSHFDAKVTVIINVYGKRQIYFVQRYYKLLSLDSNTRLLQNWFFPQETVTSFLTETSIILDSSDYLTQ